MPGHEPIGKIPADCRPGPGDKLMTETKWAACKSPDQLLDYHKMKSDPRRLRLLAAACVRLLVTPDTPTVVEELLDMVERYADGVATRAEFLTARKTIRHAIKSNPKVSTVQAMKNLADDAMEAMTVTVANARHRNGAAQCELIRCLFGNPYHPSSVDPAWLTGTVVTLARGIYADRAFDRLPVLADALQDAGCHDSVILEHCRREGSHARGCWVVDTVLGQR